MHGISLDRWCLHARVSPSIVSKFLNCQQGLPALDVMHRLADALDMPRPGMRFPPVRPLPMEQQGDEPLAGKREEQDQTVMLTAAA